MEEDRSEIEEVLPVSYTHLDVYKRQDINASGQVVAAGDGAVDLAAFIAALRSAGYGGALIGHGFSVEKTRQVVKVLARLAGTTS